MIINPIKKIKRSTKKMFILLVLLAFNQSVTA